MIVRLSASPIPMPSGFVVKYKSKIFSRSVAGIPLPVSSTFSTTRRSLSSVAPIVSVPPPDIA